MKEPHTDPTDAPAAPRSSPRAFSVSNKGGLGLFVENGRVVEFMAAKPAAGGSERPVATEPRDAISQMQAARGETRLDR